MQTRMSPRAKVRVATRYHYRGSRPFPPGEVPEDGHLSGIPPRSGSDLKAHPRHPLARSLRVFCACRSFRLISCPLTSETLVMSAELSTILKLEVPIIVQLAERRMTVGEVLALVPGSIVELPKTAEEELELLVNNRAIGTGVAVKIGENFGIEIRSIGTPEERVAALGPAPAKPEESDDEVDFEALAAAMLEGQM